MNKLAAFARSKPIARYVIAAGLAIVLVITLYSLQVPRELITIYDRPSATLDLAHSKSWQDRAERVKDAFRHAYDGYLKYASGYDELRPRSNVGQNNFNGWNVTMYDSLDTMLLMNLHEYFADALPVIEKASFREVKFGNGSKYAPFFETVIRYLGGLLAAYALSGEPIILQRADELATYLEPAFGTASGLPTYSVNTQTGQTSGGNSILAEIGSCQLEWTYLAHATGSKVHFEKSDKVMKVLYDAMMERKGGMLPTNWDLRAGKPIGNAVAPGAAADSGHEYLLKMFLLTAKTDRKSLEMYLLTSNDILTNLLFISPKRGLVYATDKNPLPSHKFEHLSCFMPGLLALGAHTLDLSLDDLDYHSLGPEAKRSYDLLKPYNLKSLHMSAAKALATSCYLMYADQASGLGPETVIMTPGGLWIDDVEKWRKGGKQGTLPGLGDKPKIAYRDGQTNDYHLSTRNYFLRPETLESIFLMWKTTGDVVWRERGWEIFQSLEKEARTDSGYGSLSSVSESPAHPTDEMPSYFLAETLKYLYLLFAEEDLVPLDKWVFNTEAHPFPVFEWTGWEESKFKIPPAKKP